MLHVKNCKKATNWEDARDRVLEFGKGALKFIHVTPSPRSGVPLPRTLKGWPLDAELEARTGDVLWGVRGYWRVPPCSALCPGHAAPSRSASSGLHGAASWSLLQDVPATSVILSHTSGTLHGLVSLF